MNKNIIEWLQKWFEAECNGDWEHSFGIKIETLDNPGWYITINLEETDFADKEINTGLIEKNDSDWYFYKIEKSVFKASGDPTKLEFLLERFKEIIES
ncbi:MAG: immunity 53 family protein [Balneolaceae bacterium]